MRSRADGLTTQMGSESSTTVLNSDFVGGACPALRTLESVIAEIAPTNIPVLLVGESGTGKEMFARRLHALSPRSTGPLVKLRCASLNEETLLLELGLRGSNYRNGEQASTGTILLDEISELDSSSQRALLYGLPDGDSGPRAGVIGA